CVMAPLPAVAQAPQPKAGQTPAAQETAPPPAPAAVPPAPNTEQTQPTSIELPADVLEPVTRLSSAIDEAEKAIQNLTEIEQD
ncbi:hypothetical protein ACI393_27885, partial [Klebsiella pneumoniae]